MYINVRTDTIDNNADLIIYHIEIPSNKLLNHSDD
jgi:hypothetical protein